MICNQKEAVRAYVMKITESRFLKGFYPSIVLKQTNADLETVEEVLKELTKEGILQKQYELVCPHCFSILQKTTTPVWDEEFGCEYCGEEWEEVLDEWVQISYLNKRHK